jgi:hypothetical protein
MRKKYEALYWSKHSTPGDRLATGNFGQWPGPPLRLSVYTAVGYHTHTDSLPSEVHRRTGVRTWAGVLVSEPLGQTIPKITDKNQQSTRVKLPHQNLTISSLQYCPRSPWSWENRKKSSERTTKQRRRLSTYWTPHGVTRTNRNVLVYRCGLGHLKCLVKVRAHDMPWCPVIVPDRTLTTAW